MFPSESSEVYKAVIRGVRMRQEALEYAGDGIIITGSFKDDCPIVFCNSAFAQLTGYAKEEILGRNCRFLQGAHSNPQAKKDIRCALQLSQGFSGRILNYRKDGSTFWNHLTITPMPDHLGSVEHFVGIQRDVTALYEAEQRQQKSEKLHQAYKKAVQNLQKRLDEQEEILRCLRNGS